MTRANMANLLMSKKTDVDFDSLDLGARMTSSSDIVSDDVNYTDISDVKPFHITSYPVAYRNRFDRLKSKGIIHTSLKGFILDSVEKQLKSLEKENGIDN